MIELMQTVFQIYRDYSGKGAILTFFLIALLYLFVTEKEKTIKIVILYCSIFLLVLFFCPLFAYLLIHVLFDNEVYYRLIWLMPIGITIAYAMTRLIINEKVFLRKLIIGVVGAIIIMWNGSFVYSNPTFVKAENAYQIPQVVVEICEVIRSDEDYVRACMPEELIPTVRQYTSMIRMPYGRENLVGRWNFAHPMYETAKQEVIDVELFCTQGREYNCHFIVVGDNHELKGSFEDYDYSFVTKIGIYSIYKDDLIDFTFRGMKIENKE